jgi:hypothetical protein
MTTNIGYDDKFPPASNKIPTPDFVTRSKESLTGLKKPATVDPLAVQVDGDHYKLMAIQPVEFIHANKLGYFEGNVVKYVSRWKNKNGVADLRKAIHYLELLIKLEGDSLNQ